MGKEYKSVLMDHSKEEVISKQIKKEALLVEQKSRIISKGLKGVGPGGKEYVELSAQYRKAMAEYREELVKYMKNTKGGREAMDKALSKANAIFAKLKDIVYK